MNSYNLIIGYASHNGGTNNLSVVKVTVNYAIDKCFTGKTALKRATTYFNKIINKADRDYIQKLKFSNN